MNNTKQTKRMALIKAITKSDLLKDIEVYETLYGKPRQIVSIVRGKLNKIRSIGSFIEAAFDIKFEMQVQQNANTIITQADKVKAVEALWEPLAHAVYSDILHYARKHFDPADPVQVRLLHVFAKSANTGYLAEIELGWFDENEPRFAVKKVKR